MASSIPLIRTQYGSIVGVELFFEFPNIQSEALTFLDADSSAGATTLTANGVDFATNQYVVIGNPGSERTEIALISSASATSIVVGALSFAHNRGDVIRFVPYNQIVAERSTDGGSTYTPLSAINIRPDATESYLQRPTDASTDYYKYRFYNSTSTNYSAYSSSVIATGFGDNTVWSVKNRALDQLGEKIDSLITDSFLNDALMEARRIADQNPAVMRWSFRTKFGQVIGQMLAGQWSITAPTDLRDRNSYKNILSLRMGNQNRPITYQDRKRFNQSYLNIVHTTVASAYTAGGLSLVLTSTHDLDASGTISVANNSVADGLISITYSANNKTTNTLTITAASGNIAAGTDVWQRATFGLPSAYTIDNASIYFDLPLSTTYDGQDLKGDYYKSIPVISNDSDTFDEPFYDLYVPYLKFKIKYKKANGKVARDSDPDWKDWIAGLGELISQEVPGQRIQFVPDMWSYLSGGE